MKLVRLLAVGLVGAACQNGLRPPPIQPGPDWLMIIPAIEALKVGETEGLTAVVASGTGSRRTVPASWSSDAPEVVSVSDDGRVRGVSLGKATIRATFEALSAVLPLRVVPDYEGAWSGKYRVVNCTRLSGRGPDYCRNVIGSIMPVSTELTQRGAGLTGTLEFYSNTGRLVENGPVEGAVEESGALVLTGTTRSVDPVHPAETTLSDWQTTLAGDGNRMEGRFNQNLSFTNAWGPQKSVEECVIVRLERPRAPG